MLIEKHRSHKKFKIKIFIAEIQNKDSIRQMEILLIFFAEH